MGVLSLYSCLCLLFRILVRDVFPKVFAPSPVDALAALAAFAAAIIITASHVAHARQLVSPPLLG